jgi:hypothetical protein
LFKIAFGLFFYYQTLNNSLLCTGYLVSMYTNRMELSERYIQTLEKEGFADVFEWQDSAGKAYVEHVHAGKVTYLITDGAITFTLQGVDKVVQAGDRFNVPVGIPHSMLVGPQGWIGIVGEEISGDA